jgi:hypothetical protein
VLLELSGRWVLKRIQRFSDSRGLWRNMENRRIKGEGLYSGPELIPEADASQP